MSGVVPKHWQSFGQALRRSKSRCDLVWEPSRMAYVARLIGSDTNRKARTEIRFEASGEDPTVALNRLAIAVARAMPYQKVQGDAKVSRPAPVRDPHARPAGDPVDGVPVLDVLAAFTGPCDDCGFPDKRHRLADRIIEAAQSSNRPSTVAAKFDVDVGTVEELVAYAERRRKHKKSRWKIDSH